jgi:hypothetical protein
MNGHNFRPYVHYSCHTYLGTQHLGTAVAHSCSDSEGTTTVTKQCGCMYGRTRTWRDQVHGRRASTSCSGRRPCRKHAVYACSVGMANTLNAERPVALCPKHGRDAAVVGRSASASPRPNPSPAGTHARAWRCSRCPGISDSAGLCGRTAQHAGPARAAHGDVLERRRRAAAHRRRPPPHGPAHRALSVPRGRQGRLLGLGHY